MICYRDQTFCSYYKECEAGKECFRALTEEVQAGSESFGLLICQFAAKPDCYKEKDNETN